MELELISASFLPGDPADCAKVFHLEGLVDLAVLPPPWASTTMSPLRDRYALSSICLYVYVYRSQVRLDTTYCSQGPNSPKRRRLTLLPASF